MRKSKKLLSLILSVLMVLSVVSIGFTASAVELDPVVLTKMERPTVSFTTSGMTRVSAGVGSFALGNVIVKATPSGVPENYGSYADIAYDGETPVATTVSFSSEYDVTDLSVSCTSGSDNLVLSDPTTNNGVTTWSIVSGNANAGDYLEFTATYNYEGRSYASRCYSYVENIDNSCAVSFSVYNYSILGTSYFAVVYVGTRILGKGVKHSLSNYDGDYGYYNAGAGTFNSYKQSGYTASYIAYQKNGSYSMTGGDSSYADIALNGIKHYSNVFIDTSTTASLADINLRMHTFNIGISYNNTKDNPAMYGSIIFQGEKDADIGLLNNIDGGPATRLGFDANDLNTTLKIPRGYAMNNALFRGSIANINDNEVFTVMNYFRTEYSGAAYGRDVVNKTLTPLYLKFNLVDKSALRATIATVLSSEPTSPLVSNIYKGVNPQSWYYKSGFGNFKSALANAYAVLGNETATQSEIDSAQQSLDAMYSNLVLNTADYTQVNDLLEQADAILENSEMYTTESIALLQQAYDGVVYNYNLFYQSAVDTMAGNISKAINNMQYVDADYSAVTTAITNSDVSQLVAYINSNADKSFTYDGQTVSYYTSDFVTAVNNAKQVIDDAVAAVDYTYDISRQADVDAFATAINNAYNSFAAITADYTATLAIKNYAMGMKASNYTNFTAVRTAANKVRTNYSVLRQAEVDVMASDIATAIGNLILKDATKTSLETALALTPAYAQENYTTQSYSAWTTLVSQGQTMLNDSTLTILDNQTINDKAAEITAAFNALTLKPADKTPLETALALTPELEQDAYTVDSYTAWSNLVTEGQTMLNNTALTIVDNATIAQKAADITTAFNALELADTGYTFEVAEGSDAVIDTEKGFIYGLEEGVSSLDGYVRCEGCELVITQTDNGFGTGTKVEVVHKNEVVETYYIVIFGDVTGDGFVDSFDVSVLCAAANFETEFEENSAYAFAADLNGDEFVDSFDCSVIISAANYETTIPQK